MVKLMSNDWGSYFCRVDNNVASIFVDLGISSFAPIESQPELVWLRLTMNQPREDGLSSSDEFSRLCNIEDALFQEEMLAELRSSYVGRNTANGHRDYYLYANDATGTERHLIETMARFPEYRFEVGHRADPDWSTHAAFLYPSARQRQTIQNNRLLKTLEEHGDRHEIVREVSHWLYFKSARDRTSFTVACEELGYKVADESEDAEYDAPYGLRMTHDTSVDPETIDGVVLKLFDLAAEHDGQYDGWETSVRSGT